MEKVDYAQTRETYQKLLEKLKPIRLTKELARAVAKILPAFVGYAIAKEEAYLSWQKTIFAFWIDRETQNLLEWDEFINAVIPDKFGILVVANLLANGPAYGQLDFFLDNLSDIKFHAALLLCQEKLGWGGEDVPND